MFRGLTTGARKAIRFLGEWESLLVQALKIPAGEIRRGVGCPPDGRAAPEVRWVGSKVRGPQRPHDFFPETLKALWNGWRQSN